MDIKQTPEDNDQTPAMGRTERKKVMGQLHISLDPARVGADATSLQRALRAMIIGQDEVIDHIVDVYQMYVTGLTATAQMAQAGSGTFFNVSSSDGIMPSELLWERVSGGNVQWHSYL